MAQMAQMTQIAQIVQGAERIRAGLTPARGWVRTGAMDCARAPRLTTTCPVAVGRT